MVEAELYNGRVAMMGVAGILLTDAVGLPKFWLAGAEVSGSSSSRMGGREWAAKGGGRGPHSAGWAG